ncbi:hypothetical protein [Embleya sp. NBC_00896]|uniref:hypothetical protein n=1 Tax=Embleya sp. NBC_00896 TaxID=2975961 RepID=UPI00386FD793|nr:hypothetical protein OG928_15740 [Embleya sp. NBC_00896]
MADSGARPWLVPLVVAGGAFLSVVLVRLFASAAAGRGTDAAIDAAHHRPLGIRGRVAVVKIGPSALTAS